MKQAPRKRPSGQTWKTLLRHHMAEVSGVGACDFLQVTDLFFRPLFAFFLVELKSRKVIHVNVTRAPTDPWVAHQVQEATPYGQAPKYLIRDTDRKFGQHVARVAFTSGIKVLRTPYRTRPRECRLRTLSGKRETSMSGSFPDFAGEATPTPPEAHMFYPPIKPDRIKGLSRGFRRRRCFRHLRETRRIK